MSQSHRSGHRRFRLSSKKNAERKKYSLKPSTLPVSIPLSDAVSVFKVSLPIDLLSFNVSIPLEAFLDSPANSLGTLKSRLVAAKAIPPGWFDASPDTSTSDYATFCKLQTGLHNSCTVQCSLRIFADIMWTVFYCGRQVEFSHTALLADIPVFLNTVSRVTKVMKIVDTAKLCCGNPDDKYAILHTARKGHFMDSSGTQVVASLESGFSTIRHSDCELILGEKVGIRCEKCKTHRKSLNSMLNRHQKGSPSDRMQPSSHANFSRLSTPEKIGRLHNLHQANRQLKQQLERLNRRITQVIEQDGVVLDEVTHSDFKTIMEENAEKATNSFPDGSFQQLFWEQQQQASSVKDSQSMRWHPLIIKWCIYLRHLSSGAYEALRSSGCVKLPSQRTLRDYTHYVRALPGFSDDVDKQLIEAAKLQTCEEFQKYVVLVMDEMHIKEDLVYDKHSGELVGFVNLGETNNHLLQFEQEMEGSTSEHEPLANSMVVIMVRGHLQFPYAQFPCASVTGDLLFDPFWEAVSRLERCGLKVLALTWHP